MIGYSLGRFLGLCGQILTAIYILGVAIQQASKQAYSAGILHPVLTQTHYDWHMLRVFSSSCAG